MILDHIGLTSNIYNCGLLVSVFYELTTSCRICQDFMTAVIPRENQQFINKFTCPPSMESKSNCISVENFEKIKNAGSNDSDVLDS